MGVDMNHVHTKHGVTAQIQVELHDNDRVFRDYSEGVMADFALSEEDYAWLAQYDIVHRQSGDMRKTHSPAARCGRTYRFDFSDKWDSSLWQTLVPHFDFAFASAPQEDEALRLKMKQLLPVAQAWSLSRWVKTAALPRMARSSGVRLLNR